MSDEEMLCGYSYDHTLRVVDERDGYTTYECTECGAEVTTEPEDDDAGTGE